MKKKEVMHIRENVFQEICLKIMEAENLLPPGHTVRNELCEVRLKLNSAIRINRQDSRQIQDRWVYKIESDVQL